MRYFFTYLPSHKTSRATFPRLADQEWYPAARGREKLKGRRTAGAGSPKPRAGFLRPYLECRLPLCTSCLEEVRLLKKPPMDRLVVPNRVQNAPNGALGVNRVQRKAQRSFSTGSFLFDTPPDRSLNECGYQHFVADARNKLPLIGAGGVKIVEEDVRHLRVGASPRQPGARS